MMPAVATLAEVTSVAAATMAMRSGPVGNAERARLLLRQRHHVHAPAQRHQHDGAERDRAEQRQRDRRRWWRRGCRAARTSSPEAGCRDRRDISRGRRRRRAASRSPRRSAPAPGSDRARAAASRSHRPRRPRRARRRRRSAWMPKTPSEKKMPSTAPSAAPEDAPRISGDTSGLRNRPWNAVPATASAAPTSTAASTRGPRTCRSRSRPPAAPRSAGR